LKFYNSASRTAKAALNKCRAVCGKKRKKIISLSSAVAILAGVVLISANYRVGYTIKVDDTILGTVAAKSEYYNALNEIKKEVNAISQTEFEPSATEEFNVEIVSVNSFTEKKELLKNIKSTDSNMAEACTISADGEFVLAVATPEEADSLITDYLKTFDEGDENVQVSYGADVTVSLSHVPYDAVADYDTAAQELAKGKTVTHTVTADDTVEAIAESYQTSAEEILQKNETEEIEEGMTLEISTDEPAIPIKTIEHIDGNVEIPFETETVEDETVYEGQTRIREEGSPGTKYLNAYITRVNGVITMEDTIESYIVEEPVTEVVAIGTKEVPPSVGTGEFAMPVSGRLSSPYGQRWGRTHAGIDIAATTGTPIFAADNGIVIESEYQSNGYGNIIKVDHQNGYVTYYAHCSELYANVGDIVKKGDKIAAVGSTGRSTGPHLHFEIRKDGNHKNPLDFVE